MEHIVEQVEPLHSGWCLVGARNIKFWYMESLFKLGNQEKHRIHDLLILNYHFAACNMYPKSLKDECSKTSTSNMTFIQANQQEITGNYM